MPGGALELGPRLETLRVHAARNAPQKRGAPKGPRLEALRVTAGALRVVSGAGGFRVKG